MDVTVFGKQASFFLNLGATEQFKFKSTQDLMEANAEPVVPLFLRKLQDKILV